MEVLWEQNLSDTTLNTGVTRTQDTLLKVNEVGARGGGLLYGTGDHLGVA